MYLMNHKIVFNNAGNKVQLALLHSVVIKKSVENLADTATIILPEQSLNSPINIESKINRGTAVSIELGYNDNYKHEFSGFIQDIVVTDNSIEIVCEDDLFVFRKQVNNKYFKITSVKEIVQYIINQIDSSYTLSCDYDLAYEKYAINQATGYDVLMKLKEEIKANIYFDSNAKILHIHAPYSEKKGNVKYSMQKNIENSSLQYKRAVDKKVEVTIESIDSKGKITTVKTGSTGGDSVTLKVGTMSEADIKRIAQAELIKRNYDGFEGSFDTWLIPYVEPTYTAEYNDDDYPDKKGRYYVSAVETTFSDNGGVRSVTLGVKLS